MRSDSDTSKMAEHRFISEFKSEGLKVYEPVSDSGPVDLLVEGEEYHGIQVKHARWKEEKGVVNVHLVSYVPEGHNTYSEDDIDWFAIYCSEIEELYLVNIYEAPEQQMNIREREPERDDPRINKAEEFRLQNRISEL